MSAKAVPGKPNENSIVNSQQPNPEACDFDEALKDVPQEVKAMFLAMNRTSLTRAHHPIFDKFTSEHVDKFLDYMHEDDVNGFRFESSNRWFKLGYSILGIAFLGFLIVFLTPTNKDILSDMLKIFVAFAGGFGAGVGWKSKTQKPK